MRVSMGKQSLLWLMGFCYSLSASATDTHRNSQWFMGIGTGSTAIHLKNQASVANGAPPPFASDNYSLQNSRAAILQVLLGERWYRDSVYLPSYDIFFRYTHYFQTTIKGNIEEYGLPEFLNYSYRLQYDADAFMLMSKLDLFQYQRFLPYVAGGIGFIVNHLYNYSEAAYPTVTARVSPNFGGRSSVNAALTLGVGFDFMLTPNAWFTLGYEHLFQGNASTNTGNSTWAGTSLNIGNINMDTIFVTLSANLDQF